MNEESITDRLLLDLARYSDSAIKLRKWSRQQEGTRSGADWDWWFADPVHNRYVGLRVQAKRINYFAQRFDHLDYTNKHGRQVDKLRRSAATDGLYPIYCLYLASNTPPPEVDARGRHSYGCSVMSAPFAATRIDAGLRNLVDLWPGLRPWSDLVCDRSGTLVDVVDQAARALMAGPERVTYGDAFGDDGDWGSLIRESPPQEVDWLLGGSDGEYEGPLPDVSGTLVIEQRRFD